MTFNELLNDYRSVLGDSTYAKALSFYIDGRTDAKKLQLILFDEEWDFMCDSRSDARARSRGESPMNQSYRDRIYKKRTSLGVTPLSESGHRQDDSSMKFCEAIIKNSPRYRDLKSK